MKKLTTFLILLLAPFIALGQTTHGKIQTDEIFNSGILTISGATPSVTNGNIFATSNGSPITITNFLNGVNTQRISVICADLNTSIANNANIVTSNGTTFTCGFINQELDFILNGTVWVQASGGVAAGCSPSGNNNALQKKSGTACVGTALTENAGTFAVGDDFQPLGPNPYVDPRSYGVRALDTRFIPAVPGITGSISSGTTALTGISTSNCSNQTGAICFRNGDGIAIPNAGPSQSMVAPTPAVVPSLPAGPTGIAVTVAGPAGPSTYNYKIVAVDKARGMTVPGPVTTITTGKTNLGARSVGLTSCARANKTVTCQTSGVHELAVGAAIIINQTIGDGTFSGTYLVGTVPDNTHFTYTSGFDTSIGASTSSTGGTVHWFNENLISWSHVAGAHQYIICSDRIGGGFVPIGITLPDNQTVAPAITDMALAWDDLGSPLRDNFQLPYWAGTNPCTASSPQNDELTTTIVSGAPGTSFTLANAASNTVSNGTILFDNSVNFLAAVTAAHQTPVNIPYTFIPGTATGFVFNSYLILPTQANICQLGPVQINDTIEVVLADRWSGSCPPASASVPSSGWEGFPSVSVGPAYPGIYKAGGNLAIGNLQFTDSANLNNKIYMVYDGGGVPSGTLNSMNMSLSGNMSMGIVLRANTGNSVNGLTMRGHFLFASSTGSIGDTTTPSFYGDPAGIIANYIATPGRGLAFKSVTSPFNGVCFIADLYMNGGVTPPLTLISGGANQFFHLGLVTEDTVGLPLFANLNSVGSKLTIDDLQAGPNSDGVSFPPLVSGFSTPVIGASMVPGYDRNVSLISGTGLSSTEPAGTNLTQQFIEGDFWVGNNHSVFVNSPAIGAPTAGAPTAGGSVPIGTINYRVVPVWANGGEGNYSLTSNSVTTTSGFQTIPLTWPAASGNPLGYDIYRNGVLLTCTIPNVTTNAFSDTLGFACGASAEQLPTGGPTMLMPGTQGIVAPQYILSGGTTGGKATISGTFTSNRPATWPDASGTVGLYTGAFSTNDCIKASITAGFAVFVSAGGPCGTFVNPMSAIGQMIGGGTAGAPVAIAAGKTGQSIVASNGATPAFASPGINGSNVTSTPYTVQCDSSTALIDRGTVITLKSGASVVNVPDPSTSGCGGNFVFSLVDDGASAVTINRGTTATFNIANGNSNSDGQTSFTMTNGQFATINSPDNTNWTVRFETLTTVPVSAAVLGSTAGGVLQADTSHNIVTPLICLDSSGSGTAQSCSTSPTFTPAAGDIIIYKTTTANTGSVTVNVNASSAATIKKWQGTANLAANDLQAGIYNLIVFDGTNWEIPTIGNAPSGGGSSTWNGLTNPTGNMLLNTMSTFLSEWDYTTGLTNAWKITNVTAATVTTPQNGPQMNLDCGQEWTGAGVSTEACYQVQVTPGTGLNTQSLVAIKNTSASTNTNNGFSFNGNIYLPSGGKVGINSQGNENASFASGGLSCASGTRCVAFFNTGNIDTGGIDGTVSRVAAGVIGIGTGAAGSTAGTAALTATRYTEAAAPTTAASSGTVYEDSTQHEYFGSTNGASTFGMLNRTQPGAINNSAQTAAITTATLCAASAGACNVAGQYKVHFDFIEDGAACATPGTGGVTFLLTWTDANATTHSAVSLAMDDASGITSLSQTFHFQTTLAAAWASGDFTISSNGSVIQYATGYTACTSGTGSYRLQAAVVRLQ